MDRIARLRRPELERKLRDARKVLREIARPGNPARSSRLAAWALELIFQEPRAEEIPVESGMSPLRLEEPVRHAAVDSEEETATSPEPPLEMAETLPFVPPNRALARPAKNALSEELLRQLIG